MSDRGEIKARLDEAKKKVSKSIDFEWEETTDVIDCALEELERTSEEGLEKLEAATKDLRQLVSIRPPKPGPTEKVKVG